mmetsp:Transcript_133094/g.188029  ORF Transcript_133094/g.188029 Transcript_133094/m.188029 type:complete len:178 (-) Transcript_133094:83-616(-)
MPRRSDSRPRRRSDSRDYRRSPPRRRSPSPRRRSPRRSPPPRSPARRSRSRSPRCARSPARKSPVKAPAPGGTAGGGAGGEMPGDIGKAEVVAGKPRPSTGEQTWRAEIMMPQVGLGDKSGAYNYGGKVRTMCIRGPHRVDKQQAEDDAVKLEEAARDGDTRKVKAIANDMVRGGAK